MSYNLNKLKTRIDEIFEETVEIRRHLHMYPELGEHEEKTASFIQKKLTELGIPFEKNVAGHGISAIIYGKNREHGAAIRADIDALPLTEKNEVPFRSKHEGVMHACGHDIHTAILLGTAKVLNEIKDELPGSVRLLFQPSEETIGGAKQMIEEGCLKAPEINSIIGLHVESSVDAGSVQLIPGAMNAASCEFRVKVIGKSCHGAHPSDGVDSLLPACTMVSSLQSIITRRVHPADAVLITVGKFNSGIKNNIISGETLFSGIIRTLKLEYRGFVKTQIESMCKSIAQAYGAECEVTFRDSYPSLENDDTLFNWVKESSEEMLGADCVEVQPKPSLGADDFAYFCHGTRGLYYNIGTRRPGETETFPIHSDRFNPDEECIRTGMLTETASILKILEEESKKW